jgi:FixJ family two-component response regulator
MIASGASPRKPKRRYRSVTAPTPWSCSSRKGDIDLLMTDLVMPGVGGRELARQCTALGSSLKVIYLSGYTQDSLLSQETFEQGTEFIEKPFTREAILDRISRVLRR